jgi:hypothetical protein
LYLGTVCFQQPFHHFQAIAFIIDQNATYHNW